MAGGIFRWRKLCSKTGNPSVFNFHWLRSLSSIGPDFSAVLRHGISYALAVEPQNRFNLKWQPTSAHSILHAVWIPTGLKRVEEFLLLLLRGIDKMDVRIGFGDSKATAFTIHVWFNISVAKLGSVTGE